MRPDVKAFFDPATSTVSYLVWDPDSKAAAIIDPVLDFDPAAARLSTTSGDKLLSEATSLGLNILYVLETHAHADHLTAARYIRAHSGARVAIGRRIAEVQKTFAALFEVEGGDATGAAFDMLLGEGDTLPLGALTVSVLDTPGHTPADLTYVIGDAAFVGDTLFMPDYGTARTDFPGGDARALYRSIVKILALDLQTRIFVCHDYPPADRTEPRWETTVREQRSQNIHIHDGVSEDAFVAMRQARDAALATPRLIYPSLQVNIRGGELPDISPGGRRFLKVPLSGVEGLE